MRVAPGPTSAPPQPRPEPSPPDVVPVGGTVADEVVGFVQRLLPEVAGAIGVLRDHKHVILGHWGLSPPRGPRRGPGSGSVPEPHIRDTAAGNLRLASVSRAAKTGVWHHTTALAPARLAGAGCPAGLLRREAGCGRPTEHRECKEAALNLPVQPPGPRHPLGRLPWLSGPWRLVGNTLALGTPGNLTW